MPTNRQVWKYGRGLVPVLAFCATIRRIGTRNRVGLSFDELTWIYAFTRPGYSGGERINIWASHWYSRVSRVGGEFIRVHVPSDGTGDTISDLFLRKVTQENTHLCWHVLAWDGSAGSFQAEHRLGLLDVNIELGVEL